MKINHFSIFFMLFAIPICLITHIYTKNTVDFMKERIELDEIVEGGCMRATGELMKLDIAGYTGKAAELTAAETKAAEDEINSVNAEKEKACRYLKDYFAEYVALAYSDPGDRLTREKIRRYITLFAVCFNDNTIVIDGFDNAAVHHGSLNGMEISDISRHFGLSIKTDFPEYSGSSFVKAIQTPCIIAVIDGIPLRTGRGVYCRIAAAGAHIRENRRFFVTEDKGERVYHAKDCERLKEAVWRECYDYAYECAENGAFPCETCIYGQIAE